MSTLAKLAEVFMQRESDRTGRTARLAAQEQALQQKAIQQAQLKKILQDLELAPADQQSQIDLRAAQAESARALANVRENPVAKPVKQVERTVDLGDKVEYIYTNGEREVKPKGVTPGRPDRVLVQTWTGKTDAAGNPIMEFTPRADMAGREVSQPPTVAQRNAAAGVTAAQLAKKDGYTRALPVLQDLAKRATTLNAGRGGGLFDRAAGAMRGGASRLGMDGDVDMYRTGIRGFTPLFARSVGHVGMLTEQDVERTEELFPRVGDSADVTKAKLERIQRIMGGSEALPFQWEEAEAPGDITGELGAGDDADAAGDGLSAGDDALLKKYGY